LKILPTGWSAAVTGSFRYAIMIKVTSRDGTILRWSTKPTAQIPTWTDSSYIGGRLAKNGLGSVRYEARLESGGGLAAIGDFTFILLNQDGYWASTLANLYLQRAEVEVKRFILDLNPATFSDGLTVFKGIIANIERNRYNITVTCQVDEREHTNIPRTLIEDKTFPTPGYEIPEKSSGKPVPICFGVLDYAEAVFNNALNTTVYGPAVATGGAENYLDDSAATFTDDMVDQDIEIIGGLGKGQIAAIKEKTSATRLTIYDQFQTSPNDSSVYKISDTLFEMVLADHDIKEFTPDSDGVKQFWFWDDSAKIYVPMNPNVLNTTFSLSGKAGFSFLPGLVKKNEITFLYPYPFTLVSGSGWSNLVNCRDWDNTTYAAQVVTGGAVNFMLGKFATDLKNMLGDWDTLYIFAVWHHDAAGSLAQMTVQAFDAAGVAVSLLTPTRTIADYYYNALMRAVYLPPTGFADGANAKLHDLTSELDEGDWGTLNFNRLFKITLSAPTGSDYTLQLWEAGICFAKTVALNEQTRFFASLSGRMYGSGWTGKTATDLVEGPGDVISKILRADLGVAEANIAVSNLSNWKLAYQIKESINSLREIEAICKETWMVYYKKFDGTHIAQLVTTAIIPPVVTSKTLSKADVLTTGDNRESTLQVEYTPIEQVFNEFYVRYDKDPATGDYRKVMFIKTPSAATWSADYSNLVSDGETYWNYCHSSYTRYGFTGTKEIKLDRVRDPYTAKQILITAVLWHYAQRRVVAFESGLRNLDLELLDCISLSSSLEPGDFLMTEIEDNLNTNRLSLRMRDITQTLAI
jgi:hypothetical protein